MNKKGFVDTDLLYHPAFLILLALAWVATIVGWMWSRGLETGGFPVWQVIIILLVEAAAAYFFVARSA